MVRQRLSGGTTKLSMTREKIWFHYPFGPKDVVEFFRQYFGPTQVAFFTTGFTGPSGVGVSIGVIVD
jgi:hypothetical protein